MAFSPVRPSISLASSQVSIGLVLQPLTLFSLGLENTCIGTTLSAQDGGTWAKTGAGKVWMVWVTTAYLQTVQYDPERLHLSGNILGKLVIEFAVVLAHLDLLQPGASGTQTGQSGNRRGFFGVLFWGLFWWWGGRTGELANYFMMPNANFLFCCTPRRPSHIQNFLLPQRQWWFSPFFPGFQAHFSGCSPHLKTQQQKQ